MCLTFIRRPNQMKSFDYNGVTFNTTLDELGNVLVESSKVNLICGLCSNSIETRVSYRHVNNIYKCRFVNTYYSGSTRVVTKRFIPLLVLLNAFYSNRELSFAKFLSTTVAPYWKDIAEAKKASISAAQTKPIDPIDENINESVEASSEHVDETLVPQTGVTLTDKLNEAMKLVDGFYECANNMNELLKKIKAL